MTGRGAVNGTIVVVGQNPSAQEDKTRVMFVGESGTMVKEWLKVLGVPDGSTYLTAAVKCHTKDNRPPSAKETKTCRDMWLVREICKLPNVRAVITLGKTAKYAVMGSKKDQTSVTITEASRAEIQDPLGRKLAVFPLPHPAYYLRARDDHRYFLTVVLPEVRSELKSMGLVP